MKKTVPVSRRDIQTMCTTLFSCIEKTQLAVIKLLSMQMNFLYRQIH